MDHVTPHHMRLRFITVEDLLERTENGDAFKLVEVLAADKYAEGHLPNAVSLPLEEIDAKAATVLPDKKTPVIVYCASYKCSASTNAAKKLLDMGYADVLDFKGGKLAWKNAGLPLPPG